MLNDSLMNREGGLIQPNRITMVKLQKYTWKYELMFLFILGGGDRVFMRVAWIEIYYLGRLKDTYKFMLAIVGMTKHLILVRFGFIFLILHLSVMFYDNS